MNASAYTLVSTNDPPAHLVETYLTLGYRDPHGSPFALRGTGATQAEADARIRAELEKLAAAVEASLALLAEAE
jgi:hypothetical protein